MANLSDYIPQATGGGVNWTPYRYWRFNNLTGGDGAFAGCSYLRLWNAPAGPNLPASIGGTGTASQEYLGTTNRQHEVWLEGVGVENWLITGNLNSSTDWIQWDFGAGNAQYVTHYQVGGYGSPTTTESRSFQQWDLVASNDETNWTVIHQVTAVDIQNISRNDTPALLQFRVEAAY